MSITVNKAINRGQLLVNIPVFIIMMGLTGGLMYLATSKIIPSYFAPGGILIGPGVAWIYWSFAITKWRIWALSNVEDHFELKMDAVAGGLIWEDGSFFERTEIRSSKEKKLIHELEKRYKSKIEKRKFKDDVNIPAFTEISYSKTSLTLTFVSMVGCFLVGVFFLIQTDRWGYGILLTLIGGIFAMKNFEKLRSNSMPLILNNSGITIGGSEYSWTEVIGEMTTIEGFGKHRTSYLIFWVGNDLIKTNIDEYETTLADLRNKLKIYRGRHQAKINSDKL
jgi:F0F1-type ATP synthase assembly protein I